VGAHCAAALTEVDGEATWLGTPPVGLVSGGDPLVALRTPSRSCAPSRWPGCRADRGMVGYLGYDVVRRLERLPSWPRTDLKLPELTCCWPPTWPRWTTTRAVVTLIANAVNWETARTGGRRLRRRGGPAGRMTEELLAPLAFYGGGLTGRPSRTSCAA